jgi:hypothetical protein
MPRHSAPNHSDCHVDCPDGGFAYYVEPLGPCRTGCNTAELARAVIQVIRRFGWGVVTSGVVHDMTKRELEDFARQVRQVSQGNRDAEDALDILENLNPSQANDTVDATWRGASGVDVIKTLGEAATR